MSVSIVNYGLGNLGSVVNMFKRIGTEVRLISTPDEVAASERVLLPGIGAFDHGMKLLADAGLDDALRAFSATGKPLMGICLGMQLLLDRSEEGVLEGLHLMPGESLKFESAPGLRIPHMGWNAAVPRRDDSLLAGVEQNNRFYFVHTYRVVPDKPEDTLAVTQYGQPFASMVRSGNVMGAQFHPEKSHVFGMSVLKNFAAL